MNKPKHPISEDFVVLILLLFFFHVTVKPVCDISQEDVSISSLGSPENICCWILYNHSNSILVYIELSFKIRESKDRQN